MALGYSLTTFGPITVEQGWRKVRVRLCGIDAPELAQPLGMESRNQLRQLIANARNQVILYGNDTARYGRRVAEVFVPDPTPQQPEQEKVLNDAMVRVGIAYHYAKYAIAARMGVQGWLRRKLRRSRND